ncbi:amino acid adenylation domain-containing protein, partial [Pseudoalteromonas sp. McH1-42]|uniref:amino acid adenylation domain-containing protein n=1 Tax=Pseudoalteromonas sp. McH1-42 TaxID=2917752 RepID=UPI001EF52979
QGRYVAPQTDTEQAVCEIWAQLLNVEASQISTQADFFELGGHSLLVVKLAAALRAELAVELPVKTLFNVTTLAEQAKAVEAHQGQAIRAEITAQPRVMLTDLQLGQHSLQPLSFAQQRLWFIDQLNQGSAQYNMPAAFHVQGELNLTVVEAVLQTIVDRHEVLRTVYRDDAQVIRQQASFELSYEDVRMLSETAQQQAIAGAMTQQLSQPFDLSCEVMMRAGYIQTSQSSGVMLFNMHHIASDGWSMQVLIKEFVALYLAYSQGQENPLAPLTIQYADYAQWQRTYLEDGVLDEQLGYWQQQLAQLPAVHSLPLDHPRPDVKQHQGGQVKSTLSTEVAQGLAALAKAQGLTPFMLLHGALSLLLSRHSNAQDIVIGTPVANRMQAELAPLIGFFVNTLVLNVNTAQATLADYLAHVKAVHLDAQSNQDVPFEQLVEQLNVPRSSAYTPLFQVMLTTTTDYGVTDQSIDNNWSLGDAQLSPLADDAVIAKFDLDIDMALSDTGVDICWTYDKALFSQERIETLSRHLCTLLTTFAQQTTETLLAQAPGALTMLSGAEQHELLVTFNQQVESFDATQCIHTLFEKQAQATPDATALVFNEQHISYGALNQRANQLAHYLLNEHQLTPETLVGVCSSRSVEMVVSILAILKAGGAYVPLDPSYPNSRLSHMASDAKLQHILGYDTGLSVADGLMTELGGTAIDIALLDLSEYPQDNPVQVEVSGNNLAYVIYTSGSTGKPKGVAVEHSSLVNYQCHCRTQYELTAEDVMLQFSTMSFDIFVEELFGALCQGASLVLRNEECLGSAAAFNAFCSTHQVTVMSLPTAFWKQMTDMEGAFAIATLRAVIIGGEAMGQTHMERFFSAAPTVTLFNSYGPTEATITATTSRLHAASGAELVTIGKANVNNTLLVLNDDGGLVPKGCEGELYIGGPGVARGYLNQPQLSAERFISNPYADQCLAIEAPRLYRTGDLVRYTDQGELIFIGRNDDQVKLRGFRVELGELSGILAQQPQVQDAAVTVFKVDTEQHLAAYLKLHASDSEAEPQDTLQAIRNQLAEQLPQYMQPGSLNIVDELPLTVNGKLDVAALPEPKLNVQQSEYCAPTTELEHQLVAIWAQLLSRETQDIGVTTSFFNLGGHSLLILKAVSQIQTQFEVSLTVQTIFENDTVATLAAQIERQRNQQALKQQINDASADQIERVEF